MVSDLQIFARKWDGWRKSRIRAKAKRLERHHGIGKNLSGPHTCQNPTCGNQFWFKPTAHCHEVGKYCSRACSNACGKLRLEHASAILAPRYEKMRLEKEAKNRRIFCKVYRKKCVVCGTWKSLKSRPGLGKGFICSKECKKIRDRDHMRKKLGISPEEHTCEQCGRAYTPENLGRKHYCSRVCRRRAAKERCGGTYWLRAQHFGVPYEPVNRRGVFVRDGWRCKHCGVSTPRSLLGSQDNRAPELDHILPMSAGGAHSYANTQCLCRGCNSAKGADLGKEPLLVDLIYRERYRWL